MITSAARPRFALELVTLTTLLSISLGWAAFFYPPLGLFGCALDAIDGRLARRWGVVTREGAILDWGGDMCISVAYAYYLFGATPLWALVLMFPIVGVLARKPISGRTLLTLLLLASWAYIP